MPTSRGKPRDLGARHADGQRRGRECPQAARPQPGEGVGGGTKHSITKSDSWDFPGGLGVKILPANAGDTGSIPGLGRPHKLGSD